MKHGIPTPEQPLDFVIPSPKFVLPWMEFTILGCSTYNGKVTSATVSTSLTVLFTFFLLFWGILPIFFFEINWKMVIYSHIQACIRKPEYIQVLMMNPLSAVGKHSAYFPYTFYLQLFSFHLMCNFITGNSEQMSNQKL